MDKAIYDRGMAMRRKVLGDEYVDRAIANTTDFDRQFQEHLNEHAWGAVWADDALAPRDRSMLNIGMIACLGRMHEFEAHFRGALRNGVTEAGTQRHFAPDRDLLRLPAAVDAHRVAKKVLAEEAKKALNRGDFGQIERASAAKRPSRGGRNHVTEIAEFLS